MLGTGEIPSSNMSK